MSARSLLSDHAYDWSARSIKQDIVGVAQAPPELVARAAAIGRDLARLADRALQALRQARLQMRRRSRSRPEVLLVSEFSRRAAADGLRSAGRYCRHPRARCQLSPGSHGTRRNLSDQPRVITAPRGAVRAGGERSALTAHYPIDRYRRRRTTHGEHDRALARRAALRGDERGGER
jgi:hypothetical protein